MQGIKNMITMDDDHMVYLIGFPEVKKQAWLYSTSHRLFISARPMADPWVQSDLYLSRALDKDFFDTYLKPDKQLEFEYDKDFDIYFCRI